MARKKKETDPLVEDANASSEGEATQEGMEKLGPVSPAEKLEPGESANRYRIQFDFGYKGTPGKKVKEGSDTIPDLSLTIRQLLENHTRGMDGNVQVRKPIYLDTPVPNIQDITEVMAYRDKLNEMIEKTNEFIKKEREAKKEPSDKSPEKETEPEVEKDGQTRIPDA